MTAMVTCPLPRCQSPNQPTADVCRQCRTPLRAYIRLRTQPARLFNEGLAAARDGRISAARDRFAAIIHWCPHDTEARSALALACLLLNDREEARHHWRLVVDRRPNDTTALRGLALLAAGQTAPTETPTETPAETPARGVDDEPRGGADGKEDREPVSDDAAAGPDSAGRDRGTGGSRRPATGSGPKPPRQPAD